MKEHHLDGYVLSYEYRGSWKANIFRHGELVNVVPVTWTKDLRQVGSETFLTVWFKEQGELSEHNSRKEPFLVAVAKAKDDNAEPKEFSAFHAIYRVAATGRIISNESIETRIIDRVREFETALYPPMVARTNRTPWQRGASRL